MKNSMLDAWEKAAELREALIGKQSSLFLIYTDLEFLRKSTKSVLPKITKYFVLKLNHICSESCCDFDHQIAEEVIAAERFDQVPTFL